MATLEGLGGALFSIFPYTAGKIDLNKLFPIDGIKTAELNSFCSLNEAVVSWLSLTFTSTLVFLQQPSSFLSAASVLQNLHAVLFEYTATEASLPPQKCMLKATPITLTA